MKRIVFLDFDDLMTICTSLDFRCDYYKKIIEERSDEFTPEFLAELSDKISNLTRIHNVLSDYMVKGVIFDENCLPDLESHLTMLVYDLVKGGAADEK